MYYISRLDFFVDLCPTGPISADCVAFQAISYCNTRFRCGMRTNHMTFPGMSDASFAEQIYTNIGTCLTKSHNFKASLPLRALFQITVLPLCWSLLIYASSFFPNGNTCIFWGTDCIVKGEKTETFSWQKCI